MYLVSISQPTAEVRYGASTSSKINENFLKFGVYFQSLNTKKIVEDPKYTVRILMI